MNKRKQVKIVATLGPSSSDLPTIKALIEAGADVFRLNMSHGSHHEQAMRYKIIREIEEEIGRPIGILADLQGPKIRCGSFGGRAYTLKVKDYFTFDLNEEEGNQSRVFMPHPEILKALEIGSTLLVNDGKIRLRVEEKTPHSARCIVEVGGEISDRKGINLPDVIVPVSALTEKDRKDLEFACSLDVDWIALSFVQRAQDIEEAKALINGRASIIAKIEKPSAVDNFDSILKVTDGVMVARGDLGVEMPLAEVPLIQKRLIKACRERGKPVIVATQMLESMISAPVPTRAEVSDVASAIYEGADAVMLSAESAAGSFPVKAVQTMYNVAHAVENDPQYQHLLSDVKTTLNADVASAIAKAAREVSSTVDIKAICCFTHSGTTAILNARERPLVPILALTPFHKTARKLCLYWGLDCTVTEEVTRFKMAVACAARIANERGVAKPEDRVVVTAGIPFNEAGSTNILRVAYADEKRILPQVT